MKALNMLFFAILLIGCTTYGTPMKHTQETKRVYLATHPELSADIKQNIRGKKIKLGMSKNDVTAIWGKPDKIFPKNIQRYKYEPLPWNEQWEWKGALFRTLSQDCIVTFVDDKVDNVQCDSFWGK